MYDLAAVERFLTTDTDLTYGYTHPINEDALKEAYENVLSRHAPQIISGTDLLCQIESKIRILPFGCESIDAMLEGGFREGQVLELYGDSGIKKKHFQRIVTCLLKLFYYFLFPSSWHVSNSETFTLSFSFLSFYKTGSGKTQLCMMACARAAARC